LTITALPTSTYHEVGEIVSGEVVVLPDPLYGLNQSRENLQVIQKLAGGGFYIHDGELPRTFDLSWVMDRDSEFDDLDEVYMVMGQKPIAMLISDNQDDDTKWCGYFHITNSPKAVHSYPDKSVINLSLREAV
jgi:hypothetical protein